MDRNNQKYTKKFISSAQCLLCILTKNYIKSELCCNEYKLAHKLKKKSFIVMFEKINLEKSPIGMETIDIQRCNLYKNKNGPDFTKFKEFKDLIRELKRIIKPKSNVSFEYNYQFQHYNAYFQNTFNEKLPSFYTHN